jgi:hypothetical protein
MRDREFAAMFSHYRSVGRGDAFDVYDLAAPLDRPAPSSCRRGV